MSRLRRMPGPYEGAITYAGAPWTLCKTRKAKECVDCGKPIAAGEMAFRPLRENRFMVSLRVTRGMRMHESCPPLAAPPSAPED